MTFSIDLEGYKLKFDENALRSLGGSDDVLRALEIVGQVGEGAAKGHVAVDTGNLRRSITHELGGTAEHPYVRIGTNVRYGIYQELGTQFHPAHPYLRPALADIAAVIGGGL